MARAAELIHVSAQYAIWRAYDSALRAELFSTAVRIESGLAIFDPIPLTARARAQLGQMGNILAVFITNANHARAATHFASQDRIIAPAELAAVFPEAQCLNHETRLHGLTAFCVDGAAPGECALHDERDGGALILGDALINFELHGVALLPARYCTDQKKMIRSLRRLLDLSFTQMFFAHGYPVIIAAHDRLAALLAEHA